MIDLPPDIPVISACEEALFAGWREAQDCLLRLGFTHVEPHDALTQLETDYWTALGMSWGQTPEEAAPKGELTTTHSFELLGQPSDLVTYQFDGPFLTTDFDNTAKAIDDVRFKGFYSAEHGYAVLSDDEVATTLWVFHSLAWSGFSSAFRAAEVHSKRSSPSGSVMVLDLSDNTDINFLSHLYYSVFPSAWPDNAHFCTLEVDQNNFMDEIGRKTDFVALSSLTVTRKY